MLDAAGTKGRAMRPLSTREEVKGCDDNSFLRFQLNVRRGRRRCRMLKVDGWTYGRSVEERNFVLRGLVRRWVRTRMKKSVGMYRSMCGCPSLVVEMI